MREKMGWVMQRTGVLLLSAMLLFSGCGLGEEKSAWDESEPSPAADAAADVPAADENQAPYWAQGTCTNGTLFQQLNLDGVGDADDDAYVSIYGFGDYEDKVIVIQIHLGTGETMARIFPVYGYYSLETGKLFSEDKDAILLEVVTPASNYHATDLFVLNINPVGAAPVPEIGVRLNSTTRQDHLLLGGSIYDAESTLVTGAEIVDIEGAPLQGLKFFTVDPADKNQQSETILYWEDEAWAWTFLETQVSLMSD